MELVFVALQAVFSTLANILLKLSASASGWWEFAVWQVAGNLAGLAGVLAYTQLLRTWPLHRAFPVTQGLSALGALGLGAMLVFHEPFPPRALAGTVAVMAGVILLGTSSRRDAK